VDAAAMALDLAPREIRAAWSVVTAAASLTGQDTRTRDLSAVIAHGATETILQIWDAALGVVLDSEELDGIATALYTVGGPVGMDGLFDAYASAAGPRPAPGPPEPENIAPPAAPASASPAAQTPGAQPPAAQTPAAQTPAAQTPAAQTPAAQPPIAQPPA